MTITYQVKEHNLSIELSQILLNLPISIDPSVGFKNIATLNNKLIYTFLSSQMRRVWIHHFIGAKGIILIYEGDSVFHNVKEITNIFVNANLKDVPILILFDIAKVDPRNNAAELLRQTLNEYKIKYNTSYVNFEKSSSTNSLFYGIDWLEKEMKISD